jgi:DNA mismatch repair protein MutL
MTLRHNGKVMVEVPASAPLLDRIATFFGPDVAGQLYAIEAQQGPARLTGYIADPACERGTAKMQYLFLNGRWIRDRSLGHAVQEAYRGLLMTGRYAVVFLFLELPPDQVDVNVHPTKAEVRFRDSQALHHLFFASIRDRLRRENLTARLQPPSTLRAPGELAASVPAQPGEDQGSRRIEDRGSRIEDRGSQPAWPTAGLSRPLPSPSILDPRSSILDPRSSEILDPQTSSATMAAAAALAPPLEPHKVIQLYDAYLVMETEAGMLVIDQHALHERILFEQLKQRLRSGPLETQRLLIPEPVDLSAEQAARTLEHREALAELGLSVEDFGGSTVLVTGYPSLLSRRSPREILLAVVDHLVAKERLPSREVLFNDLLSLMACHAAVRAGDRLTPEEMCALVAQRQLADDTHHCPHGRPTALLFSKQDLDKQFRRI